MMITMAERPDIDSLITAVARRLPAGESRTPLRARVLARLDERRRPWTWMTAAVCAAGVVVAAVVIGWPDGPASRSARRAEPGTASLASPKLPSVATASEGGLKPHTPSLPPPVTRRAPPATPRVPSADEIAWRARAIPALE